MRRAAYAVLLVIASIACGPGPFPDPPKRLTDAERRKDWFRSDSYDPYPLDVAILENRIADARRLLERGADPNRRWSQSGDRFPLQEVLDSPGRRPSDPIDAVRLLLHHGADPNAKWCPFETRGASYGGGPSCTSETALTPLMSATFRGSREIVQLLLDAGADPLPRDWGDASALDYAYDEAIFEMISRRMFPDVATRDRKSLEWVSKYPGSPFDNSLWRETPITRALTQREGVYPAPPPPPPQSHQLFGNESQSRVLSRLRTLLRIGADANQRLTLSGADATPLSLALRANQLRAARLLLANNADVNQRWCTQFETRNFKLVPIRAAQCSWSNGITPLMWAASAGQRDAVDLLLEFRADRSLRDWVGRTAADYAKDSNVRKLVVN